MLCAHDWIWRRLQATQRLWEIKEVPCFALHTSNTINNAFFLPYLQSTVAREWSQTHAVAYSSAWHLTTLSAEQLGSRDGYRLTATSGKVKVAEGKWELCILTKHGSVTSRSFLWGWWWWGGDAFNISVGILVKRHKVNFSTFLKCSKCLSLESGNFFSQCWGDLGHRVQCGSSAALWSCWAVYWFNKS